MGWGTIDDRRLAAELRAGDEFALGEAYDRHAGVCFGLALRVTRSRQVAEEAVQDAFLDLWRRPHVLDPDRSSLRGWLLTLTHRRAVDLVRRAERRRCEPLPEREDAAAPGAEEEGWARLQRREVRAALATLPKRERELLELAYFGGLTQSECAERLRLPLGTVKSRTSSALTRLKALLEPAEPVRAAAG